MKSRIIKTAVDLFGPKAEKILNDPKQAKVILEKTKRKMEHPSKSFEDFRTELKTLYDFGSDYFNKSYRDVSLKTMAIVVFALVYFVVPTDIIPDFLLGAGYIDDSMVILWSFRSLKKEIKKYKDWKESKREEA